MIYENNTIYRNCNINPDLLNNLIPFQNLYFPADVMTQGQTKPTNKFTQPIAGQEQKYMVHQFLHNQNMECYWNLHFRGLPIDINDPQFKMAPHYMQTNVNPAPNPPQFTFMEYSIGVTYDTQSLSYPLEGVQEVQRQEKILDPWKSSLTSNTANKAVSIPNLFGSGAIDPNRFNFLQFEIERFGTNSKDTFKNNFYLLGCSIQYKTDFNNVSAWPT